MRPKIETRFRYITSKELITDKVASMLRGCDLVPLVLVNVGSFAGKVDSIASLSVDRLTGELSIGTSSVTPCSCTYSQYLKDTPRAKLLRNILGTAWGDLKDKMQANHVLCLPKLYTRKLEKITP